MQVMMLVGSPPPLADTIPVLVLLALRLLFVLLLLLMRQVGRYFPSRVPSLAVAPLVRTPHDYGGSILPMVVLTPILRSITA